MKTKDQIDKLFDNLRTWIAFPKYQAERRLDVFFGLYLEDILKACRNTEFAKEDKLVLIPEFPLQKNDKNKECTNIDYLVFNVSKQSMHAIELKTDNHSVDDDQIKYYCKFQGVEIKELFDFVINTNRKGRSKKKYTNLAEYIQNYNLDKYKWHKERKVIYLLPEESQKIKEAGFESITFKEIAEKMKPYASEDELLSAFLGFIRGINEYQNT